MDRTQVGCDSSRPSFRIPGSGHGRVLLEEVVQEWPSLASRPRQTPLRSRYAPGLVAGAVLVRKTAVRTTLQPSLRLPVAVSLRPKAVRLAGPGVGAPKSDALGLTIKGQPLDAEESRGRLCMRVRR
jgi:hypothetical protein